MGAEAVKSQAQLYSMSARSADSSDESQQRNCRVHDRVRVDKTV